MHCSAREPKLGLPCREAWSKAAQSITFLLIRSVSAEFFSDTISRPAAREAQLLMLAGEIGETRSVLPCHLRQLSEGELMLQRHVARNVVHELLSRELPSALAFDKSI